MIFLSYATKDEELFRIREIVKGLSAFEEIEEVYNWQEHMQDNITEYMSEMLDKCDVMVLICSQNALNSRPVKKEWTAADVIDMPIIPVFMDQDHIPTILKSRRGIEFNASNFQGFVQELYSLILKKLNIKPSLKVKLKVFTCAGCGTDLPLQEVNSNGEVVCKYCRRTNILPKSYKISQSERVDRDLEKRRLEFEESARISVFKCPFCGGLIPPDIVQNYQNGESIKCKYCDHVIINVH